MKKKDIQIFYEKKIKQYEFYNKYYYEKNNPKVLDSEYDNLKAEILNLEKEYNFLKSNKSPSINVGFKPSKNFQKVQHKVPMLSLANAFSEEDLENFEKKIFNYLNKKSILEYSVEPKIDGISASLIYKNKKLQYGVSRGDGKIGEIITDNLKTIKDIPINIDKKGFPNEVEIRGEVFIKKKKIF